MLLAFMSNLVWLQTNKSQDSQAGAEDCWSERKDQETAAGFRLFINKFFFAHP